MGTVSSSQPPAWPPANSAGLSLATFAGGCFWSVELAFQRQPGVINTCVGYTQGTRDNPTYEQVCSGTTGTCEFRAVRASSTMHNRNTGHTEAVELTYDPAQVSFDSLCALFFSRINPTQKNGQGNDHGSQYRTGIYYHDEEQRRIAEAWCAKTPGCAVEVKAATHFWPAEEYHQSYLSDKGGRCGRSQSRAKGCSDPIRCYG